MVMMKFADGLKEIKVGQVCMTSNGQTGASHHRVYEVTIKSIGRKYATTECKMQFDLATGKKKTEYTWGELYSSKSEYEKVVEFRKKFALIKGYYALYFENNYRLNYCERNIEFVDGLLKYFGDFKNANN